MADNKSSLTQIVQDILDVDAQAIQVAVVSGGGGGGGGGGDVNLPAVVNSANSSTALLGPNATFTGTSFDAKDFATLSLSVQSDQSSAVNGISVQFSQDNINWDHIHTYTFVAGGNGLSYNLPVEMRYCRVVYTNGAIAQGSFRLQSVFRRTSVPPSVYTIEQGIEAKSIATPVKSVIFGETTGGGGGYVAVKVNPSGALTVEADVTGTVSVDNFPATQAVTGPLTDTQLRASAVPVSVSGVATAANQSTGNASLASIDGKLPALDSSKQPVIPSMSSGGNLAVTTDAVGTNFTAFSSQACKQLTISNQSGTTIEVRQGGAGVAFQIPTGAFYTFFGITNANSLDVRRSDTDNAQVTITARWES